jgi:HD-GYP domain-containing protein (c-di-GMP phosphodiesterase class II)/ribonuclease BN (tRNA processing enzyme)
MQGIKILGSSGSRTKESFTTCVQVTQNTFIDAGNLLNGLGEEALHVNSIFFSHAHLDHIVDAAFLIDNFLGEKEKPLKLFGLKSTLEALEKNIFNWDIWPDFSQINLVRNQQPSLSYNPIEIAQRYEVEEGVTLEPVKSVHTIPTCGYIITKEGSSILFSADSYLNDELWLMIDKREDIKAVIVDVSFPNRFEKIAMESRHLTSALLKEQIKLLNREVKVYVNHLKHAYEEEILKELEEIGIHQTQVLRDGDIVFYNGSLHKSFEGLEQKVQKLNTIGTALSAEENLDSLLEMIVKEAKNLTNADGGTLYIKDEELLRFTVVQTDSLGIKMGGTSGEITWNPLPLYLEDGSANKKMVAATCVLEDRVINIPDVYEAQGFSFDGTKAFDASTGYRSSSMLVIPLRDHEKRVIGALQLINKYNILQAKVESFSKEDEEITLSLASQAAVAINNVTLVADLEKLLEAFLRSIIYAIAQKSPYTAGHIERMVKLSLMLAEAIKNDTAYFKEKTFSAEEIKQINFAALMHDIGKLATPEQVLDKATKLECIFDRIKLVQLRMELIKKEANIAFLKKEITEQMYQDLLKEMAHYEEIIVLSNLGAEFTPNEHIQIFEELKTKEFCFNGNTYKVLEEDEAYNLSVQKGTLTNEERDIINKHAKISVDILNKLPFPKKYKEIPQISGNHHEKINGKGYPYGLKGDEISFEARILAVADIFEALTASDRPYKKANPLSTAMKILYFMAKEDDLDRDIVKFFYESGLYLEYAKTYLPDSSIDAVSVDFSSL